MGVFGTWSALLFLLRFWVVLPFIMIYPLWHQALALGLGGNAATQLYNSRQTGTTTVHRAIKCIGIIFFFWILRTNPNYGSSPTEPCAHYCVITLSPAQVDLAAVPALIFPPPDLLRHRRFFFLNFGSLFLFILLCFLKVFFWSRNAPDSCHHLVFGSVAGPILFSDIQIPCIRTIW